MQRDLKNLLFREEIEIDESMIYKERRGNHGRLLKIRVWTFGLLERKTNKKVIFLLPNRRRDTIIPIIKKYI